MNGHMKITSNGNGSGVINTMKHYIPFRLIANGARTDDSPKFLIMAQGMGGADVRIGAVWSKQTKEGEVFYSLTVDDPSMEEPLHVTAYATGKAAGEYEIVWKRPRKQEAAA